MSTLTSVIPLWAKRILLAGCPVDPSGIAERAQKEIFGLDVPVEYQDRFDAVLSTDEPLPFPEGYLDCAVVWGTADCAALARCLSPKAFLVVVRIEPPALAGYAEPVEFLSPDDACPAWLLVRSDYGLIEHGRALLAAKHPDWAYDLLQKTPRAWVSNDSDYVSLCCEQWLCLIEIANGASQDKRLWCLDKGLKLFYQLTEHNWNVPLFFQFQAALWQAVGDAPMAQRMAQNQCWADAPTKGGPENPPLKRTDPESSPPLKGDQGGCRGYLSISEPTDRTKRTDFSSSKGDLNGPGQISSLETMARSPRLLLLMAPNFPDYGLDVLWDGLCEVLGGENVVEFPRKPTLHGDFSDPTAKRYLHYPCVFNRPDKNMDLERLLEELHQHQFDAVLFGDCPHNLDPALVRTVVNAAGDTPFYVVDQQDDPMNNLAEVLAVSGRSSANAYFKRELPDSAHFEGPVFPLPFGYPTCRVALNITRTRPRELFWAGATSYGLRNFFLHFVEKETGLDLHRFYLPSQYAEALLTSKIGLSFFGMGFDTVRYWELPAHGAMLFSERPPICIPNNFRDGETAVFFDDAEEMIAKLRYYRAHPDEVAPIAAAGHEHLKRYHTGAVRARQLITHMRDTGLNV